MPHVFEGDLSPPTGRFAIVVSRYNESITAQAAGRRGGNAHGARRRRRADRRGLGARRVRDSARGRPAGRQRPLRGRDLPGRGDPRRDDARPAHQPRRERRPGARSALHSGVPVLFGVLTCDTLEQAIHRSGGNVGNKGSECALAALEMVNLLRQAGLGALSRRCIARCMPDARSRDRHATLHRRFATIAFA